MKRVIGSILVMAMGLLVTGPAGAEEAGFTKTGMVLAGDPSTRAVLGVSEQDNPCVGLDIDPAVPNGLLNGVDGTWFQLPFDEELDETTLAGRAATLKAAAPNDVDAWFYNSACALIKPATDPNAYSMTTLDVAPNGDEAGFIPAAAKYVVVDLYVGAAAEFTFDVPPVE